MSDYILTSNGELYHYGVKGMRWGVRRYQNENGTMTRAGRNHYKEGYKNDNKEAYELGKEATIYGYATAKSMKRTAQLKKKFDRQLEKDPERIKRRTQSLEGKLKASTKATAKLTKDYMRRKKLAEDHCKRLIDKYGSDSVKPIKYKDIKVGKNNKTPIKFTVINERTINADDWRKSISRSIIASQFVSSMSGQRATYLDIPDFADGKGNRLEKEVYESYR